MKSIENESKSCDGGGAKCVGGVNRSLVLWQSNAAKHAGGSYCISQKPVLASYKCVY